MKRRRRGLTSLLLAIGLVATLASIPLSGSGVASPQGAPAECAPVMPLSEVTEGTVLTGYSVVRGTEPVTFNAEVLGVWRNYLAPGKHIIVVNLFGPVIEDSGGVWFGMSGSPLYFGDRLVGSASWVVGSAYPPTTIIGVTPAEDVVGVLDYPTYTSVPRKVEVPEGMARKIAAATGTSVVRVDDYMVPLKVPFGVSGAAGRMGKIVKFLRRSGINAVPFAMGSASTDLEISTQPLRPGDNFAATVSYGDVTSSAGGTVTYVCGDEAVPFGHYVWGWWAPAGRLTFGANAARAMGIAQSDVMGSFKLFEVGDLIGTVDSERYAGVRALLGVIPPTIPITAHSYSVENDRSRDGLTEVVYQPELAWIAQATVMGGGDVVTERSGEGTGELSFTITGTRASGDPFTIERTSLHVSRWDITGQASWDLGDYLWALVENPFEDITITSVDSAASFSETFDKYKLGRVRVSTDGVSYRRTFEISAKPGEDIYIRADLKDLTGTVVRTVNLKVRVPRRASESGYIYVGGGAQHKEQKPKSFDDLLYKLQNRFANNELAAMLHLGTKTRIDLEVFDKVVSRGKYISVYLPGSKGTPDTPE